LVAEISGLVFSAQKQRKPFSLVIDERLMELLFSNNNNDKNNILSSLIGEEVKKIMDEIKNTIILKAKQVYPDTRLT